MKQFWSRYRAQYRLNLQLSIPIVLSQVGQMLTQLADTVMVGQFGGPIPCRLPR